MDDVFQEILEGLSLIEEDLSVPRNVRIKIKNAMFILSNENENSVDLKIDKSLEELGSVAEDPNVPQHTRMQIWSVVSQLETKII